MRGSVGRHAVPRQADRSQEAGVQQSQGISWCAPGASASSPQGMSAIAAAMCAAAAACIASVAARAGTAAALAIMAMITNPWMAKRSKQRGSMQRF
jgi:hypothetical protein